jgi:hypothetical protein
MMSARFWLVILLCSANVPLALAKVESVAEATNVAPVLTAAQSAVVHLDEQLGLSAPSASDGAPERIGTLNDPSAVPNTIAMTVVSAGGPATYRHESEVNGLTFFDVVLMLLFGPALVAYQLRRKQKALRDSCLFAAELSTRCGLLY